ncbi:MAG: hypothetical protein ABI873_04150 [Marmoricola sp.]
MTVETGRERATRSTAQRRTKKAIPSDKGRLPSVLRLTGEYETYDQHVDVVSALEFLFTETSDLALTVRHFERFPKIKFTVHDAAVPFTLST